MKTFKLFYYVTNNGDGSVSVRPTNTEAEAAKADEELDEGWGEPCNGRFELSIINNIIHRKELSWSNGKYETKWVPLEEANAS